MWLKIGSTAAGLVALAVLLMLLARGSGHDVSSNLPQLPDQFGARTPAGAQSPALSTTPPTPKASKATSPHATTKALAPPRPALSFLRSVTVQAPLTPLIASGLTTPLIASGPTTPAGADTPPLAPSQSPPPSDTTSAPAPPPSDTTSAPAPPPSDTTTAPGPPPAPPPSLPLPAV